MEKKNSLNKIIIVTSVIIIIFVLIIVAIVFMMSNNEKQSSNVLSENTVQYDEEQEENDKILQDENIIINDDNTQTLDRKYGKVEIVWIDENNNVIERPLSPYLGNLTPVKFNSSKSTFEQTAENDVEWYNYDNQRWANAINADGSYFVWIPRFAYIIVYYSNADYSRIIGYSDGRGLLKLNEDGSFTRITKNNTGIRETSNHYIVAPAFSKDTASGYRNGGWNKDLTGIWVAKYEMSMETNGMHTETTNSNIGNVRTSETVKAVSKPGVSSWRNINVNNCYLNSYNYDRNMESHLMKNSEWGAVVYLSYSKFGTNGKTISTNTSSDYLTGGTNSEETIYITNKVQSSNGNETGVYDLSGGAWEYMSAYINNDYVGLEQNGGSGEDDLFGSMNSKYKTVYNHDLSDNGDDYNAVYSNNNYSLTSGVRGDAIFEISNSGFGAEGWNTNSAYFPQSDIPFFIRGGDYHGGASTGIFSFNGYSGNSNAGESFRVVLAF